MSTNFAGLALALAAGVATFSAGVALFPAKAAAAEPSAVPAYLKPSNTRENFFFGDSVAVATNSANERTVVVGAGSEDSCATGVNGNQTSSGCDASGSGYVFSCSSSSGGSCTQLAYLKASNTGAFDAFGSSVAVAANSATESTVVVGAYAEESCATGVDGSQASSACNVAGSAYVYSCSSPSGVGTCTQVAYLKASNTGADDRFGWSVAVSANSATESTIVVGAWGEGSCSTGVDGNETSNGCLQAGSAYVFTCSSSSGTCFQLAYLKASNSGAYDRFGWSVGVSANNATESTVVVGAYQEGSCATGVNGNETSNGCPDAGSAYVYSCSSSPGGGTCYQLAYLKASNTETFDRFGVSVAVSANSATESAVVVGASGENSCSVGVNGNETSNGCLEAGSAYVFTCSSLSDTCTELAYLKASNTRIRANSYFGNSVAVFANSETECAVVVGAEGESSCATGVNGNETSDGCGNAGSAYVFTCSSSTATCTQLTYLKASNTGAGDFFGGSVAVTAHAATEYTVVVGARREDSCATGVNGNETSEGCAGAGSAYVFTAAFPLTTTGTTATTGTAATTGTTATSGTAGTTGTTITSTTIAVATTTTVAPAAATTATDSGTIVIAGAAGGSALLLLCGAAAAAAFFVHRRRSIPEEWSDISEEEVNLLEVGGDSSKKNGAESHYKGMKGSKPAASAASEATQYENLLRVSVEKQIGEGNFGKVFLAKHQGKVVAVKQVMGGQAEDEFMKELEVMLKLSSDRVIELFGVCLLPDHGGGLGLVMEFAALGELGDHLRDPARQDELDVPALLQISLHIAEGLAYLHREKILHRDLAVRNVLVVADGTCKLADFGLARIVSEGETYVTQSALPIRWTAPEVLAYHTVTFPSDCYSLGITLWEVFALGRMPFGDLSSNMLVATAVIQEHKRPEKPERCPSDVFSIMESLWAAKPEDRITASEAARQLDLASASTGVDHAQDNASGRERLYTATLTRPFSP